MKTTQITSFADELMSSIRSVYEEESKRIVERHKGEISKELDNLRDEIVTRAGLRIEEMLSVTDYGREIRITILKDNKK